MAERPAYRIVDHDTTSGLAEVVNSYVSQGYIPVGGLVVDPEPEFLTGKFKQALMLKPR